MELLADLIIIPALRCILAVGIIEAIAYIPLKKELKKRDQRISELEERVQKLEQDRQES